jgi:hypothetical protein
LLCVSNSIAHALELGAGAGASTQGDGVIHPTLHGWMDSSYGIFGSGTLSGQKNSVFSQQLATVRIGYTASLPNLKVAHAHIGVGGVFQRTVFSGNTETLNQLNEWSRAAGLALGAHWAFKAGKSGVVRVGWDSLFVPPGESALYLTFGHTQSVYGGLGWRF